MIYLQNGNFPVFSSYIYIISLPEGKHWNILKPFGVSAIPAAQVQMSQCRNGLTGKPNGWGYPQIIIHIFFLDSTLNKPSIWGTPILGNIHLYKYIRKYILHTYNYIYIYLCLLFIYFSWNPWSKSKSADSNKNEWFDDCMPAMHLRAVNWQTSIAKLINTNYNNSNDPNLTTTKQWSC